MIVLDASAVIALLLGTDAAEAVRSKISSPNQTLHAPHLLDVEVGQVLRRYCLFEGLDADRGELALQDLLALDIHRYGHEAMLARIWELRANLTAYDAAYIALAEVLDAPLLTLDARLARSSGHAARVALLS
jgi:predicted nucleic acid-binding protein